MIVSTRFVPRSADALTVWPFILVRPTARANRPLIEHERVHFREQAWRTPVWWARYLLSPEFRLQAEVRGYKRQIELGGITASQAASRIATLYRLNLPFSRIVQLLMA